jgi:diapolycopene oxygenase
VAAGLASIVPTIVLPRHETPDDPTIYVFNVNETDPGQALPGHENLKILPHIPYIQKVPATAGDYEALKDRVIDKLERMGLTDLRQQADQATFFCCLGRLLSDG